MLRIGLLTAVVSMSAFVAMAAPPPISAYAKFPEIDANHLDLSPNGDRLAYAATTPTGHMFVVQDLAGKVLAKADLGKNYIRNIEWAGEDHVTIEVGRSTRWSNYHVLVLNVATRNSFAVYSHSTSIMHAVLGNFGFREVRGRWYGYFGGIKAPSSGRVASNLEALPIVAHDESINLYRIDLNTGVADMVGGGNKSISGWTLDSEGKVVTRELFDNATGELIIVDATASKRYLAVKTPLHQIGIVGLGRRPGTVIVDSDETQGLVGSNELDLATGVLTPLATGKHVTGYIHDHDGLLVGLRFGERDIEMFDPALQAKFDAATRPFSKLQTRFLGHDTAWNRWLLETSGDGDSGTYYLVDLGSHQASIVGQAYPDVTPADVGHAEVVEYKAADGLEMDGILTLPPGKTAKNLPWSSCRMAGRRVTTAWALTGSPRPSPRAATRSGSRTSAARPIRPSPSRRRAMANGAARCRPTSPTG